MLTLRGIMMFKIINTIFIVLLVIQNTIAKKKVRDCPDPIQVCNRDKISFWLFNHKVQPYHELILGKEESVKNAPFLPNADFKFIIHGYKGSRDRPEEIINLRTEYLKLEKFNILVLNWGPLAIEGCYSDTAFKSLQIVGKCSAIMVNWILQYRPEFHEDQFHIVTWSMGAHVAAQFGNHFKPKSIARISGLDPAFPKFYFSTSDDVLNRHHAKFVDVLHSGMGVAGVFFSNAHYDIYLNRGTCQPGCKCDAHCDHRRVIEVFTESINSTTKFIAKKCDSDFASSRTCYGDPKKQIEVGEYCKPPKNKEEEGIYHLKTNKHPPYAQGPLDSNPSFYNDF